MAAAASPSSVVQVSRPGLVLVVCGLLLLAALVLLGADVLLGLLW